DRVLERVVALGQLGDEEPGLARLAETEEALALVSLGVLLRRVEHVELVAAEEIGVARDDRGLLGTFLLAHPHVASFLRSVELVPPELRFVLGWAPDGGRAH